MLHAAQNEVFRKIINSWIAKNTQNRDLDGYEYVVYVKLADYKKMEKIQGTSKGTANRRAWSEYCLELDCDSKHRTKDLSSHTGRK